MKKHRLALRPDDIELLLDHLVKGMTDAKWRKDKKRAEAVYDLYQTIGQALGEKAVVLEFLVDDTPITTGLEG